MSFTRKLLNRLRHKNHTDIARELGVRVGSGCEILANPYSCFGSEPYLIQMGDHVRITAGVQFITHDGGVWIFRNSPECADMDVFGRIKIGNNVFIGIRSIIMPGVEIGDNVCIAAGSIVTKNIPSGEVWGGVPARFIKTVDDYKEGVLRKCDRTKGLDPKEKRRTIMQVHPEWFE